MSEILIRLAHDFTPIFMAIFLFVIVYYGLRIKNRYEQSLNDEMLEDIIRKVVNYLDQTKNGTKGEYKFDEALDLVKDWATKRHLKFNDVELKIMIESCVNEKRLEYRDRKH